MHGFNGLKYLLTIVAVLVRTACELKKGHEWLVLAFISSAVATIMNTYWDIVVDWGLLRRHSRNFYLRDKLLISHKSVYFAAMVHDYLLCQNLFVLSLITFLWVDFFLLLLDVTVGSKRCLETGLDAARAGVQFVFPS